MFVGSIVRRSMSLRWVGLLSVVVGLVGLVGLGFTRTVAAVLPGGTVETMASGIAPNGIALGPDGNLWFTNYGNDSIGRITPIGVVTNYSGGSGIWAPYAITAAPDGNLWFANSLDNSIGRITAVEPPGAPTNAAVQPGTGRRR